MTVFVSFIVLRKVAKFNFWDVKSSTEEIIQSNRILTVYFKQIECWTGLDLLIDQRSVLHFRNWAILSNLWTWGQLMWLFKQLNQLMMISFYSKLWIRGGDVEFWCWVVSIHCNSFNTLFHSYYISYYLNLPDPNPKVELPLIPSVYIYTHTHIIIIWISERRKNTSSIHAKLRFLNPLVRQ